MLKIRLSETGEYTPVLLCAWCRQEIVNLADANYEWQVGDNTRPARDDIFFAHKSCSRTLEPQSERFPKWVGRDLAGLWAALFGEEPGS